MMFLLTSFIAALALWSLVRIVMQRAAIAPNPIQAPGPDSLYFEMRTGLILASGDHVSQLLGYSRAADCLAQFDGVAHFKNASLVQLSAVRSIPRHSCCRQRRVKPCPEI
jgi:hypothetical protein